MSLCRTSAQSVEDGHDTVDTATASRRRTLGKHHGIQCMALESSSCRNTNGGLSCRLRRAWSGRSRPDEDSTRGTERTCNPAVPASGSTASQVTNLVVESGDRRIDESGDRRAAIGTPQAWREGHLTRGQVPEALSRSEERRPIHNMWQWSHDATTRCCGLAGEEGFEPSIS